MRNSILLGLLMALFFVQCTKDDEIRMDTQTTVLEDKEQVTFLIQIVDEADTAIPGAVLINLMTGQSWSADERGLVLLSNLDVPTGGLPISVETPGKPQASISYGLAFQNHSVNANSSCGSLSSEKPMAGYFLRGRFQQAIKRRLYALIDLQYTAHRSRNSTSYTRVSHSINNLNQRVREVTTTDYKLYNQYSRLDLTLGLGKRWSLSGFEIAVEGSVGWSRWLHLDGSYVDEEGSLQAFHLPGKASGSWLGQLTGSIQKPLSNRFYLGLLLSAQTPIWLEGENMPCRQRIQPTMIGLSIGKYL